MKRFIYVAKDKTGQKIKGEVEALTLSSAAKLVRGRGLVLVSLKPASSGLFGFLKKGEKISGNEVSNFTRQLATMVGAGLPVTESLAVLRAQTKGIMQKTVSQILSDIEGGKSLSSALSIYPEIFSQTYIALLKAGEAGGVLDVVLNRLADDLEKQSEFRGKVKGALIYPIIIVIGMVVVGFVMMIFVIPRITVLYTDFNAKLPLPTQILIGVSTFVKNLWFVIVGAVLGGLSLLSSYRKTPTGKRKIDELIFRIPIYGELQRQILLTEITRTLSLMMSSGVSILEGLTITSGVVNNSLMADALKDTAKQVERGFPISYSLARHPDVFPFLLSQMVSVGEETGKTDEVLAKISHIFEVQSDQKVKGLTAAIEPIIMVVLGIGVAFLVIAIILPIYNITSSF